MAAKPRPRNRPDPRVRQNVPPEKIVNAVAERTAPGLAWLGRLPKLVLPGFVAIALLGGLIVGGIIGMALLVVVVALLGWLLAVFWPMLPTAGRVLRVTALLAVVVVAVLNV